MNLATIKLTAVNSIVATLQATVVNSIVAPSRFKKSQTRFVGYAAERYAEAV